MYKKILTIMGLILLGLTSCNTTHPVSENKVVKENVGDIEIQLEILTEAQLKDEFGFKDNPYYNFPGKMPRKYIIVFDCSITAETSTVKFSMEDIVMDLDTGYTDNAKNRTTLLRSWDPYIDSDITEANMKRKIRAGMSENDFTVSPETPYKGYLVFIMRTEGSTMAGINIPAETLSGEKGVINIDFPLIESAPEGIEDSIFSASEGNKS